MRIVLTLLVAVLIICSCSNSRLFAEGNSYYYFSESQAAKDSRDACYKEYPIHWWRTYLVEEFDKLAPPPGVNWISYELKMNSHLHGGTNTYLPYYISEWPAAAAQKGWVVVYDVTKPTEGALIIMSSSTNRESGTIYLVKEVKSDGKIVVKFINDGGSPATKQVDPMIDFHGKMEFLAYIYPSIKP